MSVGTNLVAFCFSWCTTWCGDLEVQEEVLTDLGMRFILGQEGAVIRSSKGDSWPGSAEVQAKRRQHGPEDRGGAYRGREPF